MKRERKEYLEPIMRKDITYISGVQMEEAVEIVRHCTFQDDEMNVIERKVFNADEFKKAYMEMIKYWNYERCLGEMHENTGRESFFYYGNCAVCNTPQPFIVDYQFANIEDGKKSPNWRERLVCPNCGCNSRQRFIIYKIFEWYKPEKKILMYEQNSNMYQKVSREISSITAFEYKNNTETVNTLWNYEDICSLSYESGEFELLVANEVFQRTDDYKKAFEEAARVLKTGGKMLFTVPFNGNSNVTEKIGTAIKQEIPVYQIFGWDMLDTLKECGFQDAYAQMYYGLKDGYMGYLPMCFEACK